MPEYNVDGEFLAASREVSEWGELLKLGLDPAIAGDGSGVVNVPGRTGWIYVRRPDSSDVFEARNRFNYSPIEDDPILLKKDKKKGYEIWDVVVVDVAGIVYSQVMFCVPGALSIADDVAPWFICSVPDGLQLLAAILAVKTAPGGGDVVCDMDLSEDCGGTWTTIFGGGSLPTIPDGDNCSPVLTLDSDAGDTVEMAQGDILRLNNDVVNDAEDLTASLRVRQL